MLLPSISMSSFFSMLHRSQPDDTVVLLRHMESPEPPAAPAPSLLAPWRARSPIELRNKKLEHALRSINTVAMTPAGVNAEIVRRAHKETARVEALSDFWMGTRDSLAGGEGEGVAGSFSRR
ncbi:MAG: hypothetical protein MO853_07080 [Candidatus Protistobacter heckmanni]|nr:hypothetical protein [Candidatus Protistobacter heckmanni]